MGPKVLMNRKQAEQTFKRKASPDADLSVSDFVNKKVVKPVKDYAKNVVGGAKIVGGAVKSALAWPGNQIEKEVRMNQKNDEKYRTDSLAQAESYKGRLPNVRISKK